jgi:methyl coenzyme M reductase subunit C
MFCSSVSMKFNTGDVHKNYRVIVSFVEIGAVKAILYCGRKRIFIPVCHIYHAVRVKFGIRDLHILLLSTCEFRETRNGRGRTFILGVSEISSIGLFSTVFVRFG